MATAQPSSMRPKLIMLTVVLLFAAPLIASYVMVTRGWIPGGTTNHGELVEPPRAVAEYGLGDEQAYRRGWTVLVPQRGRCESECLHRLDELARLRLALEKDIDRVHVVLLLPTGSAAPELPELVTHSSAAPDAVTALDAGGAAYVVDPEARVMMRYPEPLDAAGLLKDLERLLRYSKRDYERAAEIEG